MGFRSIRSVAGAVLAGVVLLGGWAAPARASDTAGLTLTLTQRWNMQGSAGTWAPYVVTVRNDGAGTFEGAVAIVPDPAYNGPFPPTAFPPYESPVRVPHGTQRSVVIYAEEPQGSYHAELRDGSGTALLRASATSATRTGASVAVLSDVPNADQRIGAPLKALTQLNVATSRFSSPESFPADAAHLSGLNGLVIDQFDSGTLSAAQLEAIRDFVALGGTLIEAGGASWRRALLPLPRELRAFEPAQPQTASLGALAGLAGVSTSATAQVQTGAVASWARTAVATQDGLPLVVEGPYGAGRVVALTFDPLAPPFDTDVTLSALAWSQAISRGLAAARGSSGLFKLLVGGGTPGGLTGSGPGAGASAGFPGYLDQAFNDVPGGGTPPYGLLIALLAIYVLAVSVVSYAGLRYLRRGGMLWVTVPAIALLVSGGAYAVGFGTRGQDFQLVQVQVQRLGPAGVVETDSFDGLLSPRRGDINVDVPAGSLVTTFLPFFNPAQSGSQDAVISAGPQPEVRFSNVPVWDMRPLQTLSVTHPSGSAAVPGMPIETDLRLSKSRIQGTIVNHTSHTVRDLRLLATSGTQARLVPDLAPGQTATIDAPLTLNASGTAFGKGVIVAGTQASPSDPGQAVMLLAASQASGETGELALVGITDATDTVTVDGQRPKRSARAALVEPIELASTDSANGVVAPAHLVSSFSADAGNQVDVYELAVPPGLEGHFGVSAGVVPGPPAAISVEVYDWSQGTWRMLPGSPVPGAQSTAVALTAGERAGGLLRLRVHESQPGQAFIALADMP